MSTQFVRTLVQNRVGSINFSSLQSLENAGGFSGAKIWKVETEIGSLCIRRWPRPHPSKERLSFIHRVLFHLENHGFELIAPPIRCISGESWTEFDGHFWEVSKWLPGKSNFWLDSNELKLGNAMSALAGFHRICQQELVWQSRAESPGISHRIKRLREIDAAQIQRLRNSIDDRDFDNCHSDLASRIRELCHLIAMESGDLAERCLAQLDSFNRQHALSPCLRDIWHDHVLFVGDRVEGIIDYGALNIDVLAGDFARLLGSLAMDDERFWEIGCEAIVQVLPNIRGQIPMIKAIDFANVVLAGLNWINWLFVEKREFPKQADVLARLEHIQRRLESRKWR